MAQYLVLSGFVMPDGTASDAGQVVELSDADAARPLQMGRIQPADESTAAVQPVAESGGGEPSPASSLEEHPEVGADGIVTRDPGSFRTVDNPSGTPKPRKTRIPGE